MEPTQALNFNIPKLKRQVTKDNLFEIDSNSRDAKELLASVSRTYLDLNYSGPWRVKSINMVRNTELEQEYKSKRTDMKEEGRHSRELVDQIAFCAIKEQCYITKIAKNGMMTQNLPFSIIGDFKSGVYLTKHADVQLKMVETISSQTITALFIFNTMLGKCKIINERVMSAAEPTPNFDCHVPLQPAQPGDPHIVQLQRSQIFFYEYDNDGMPVSRPRQCLPYAVITYEKVENFTMGPLKSIYCYDPMKNSSQIKKPEDKPDWKKSPRNVTNAQLPFPKNQPLDNPTRTPLPFAPVGWVSTQDAGATNPATFTPDGSQDTESGSNQCGVSAPNVLFNYPQQNVGSDMQGVVVHRSASDPRRRFNQNSGGWNTDEPTGAAEQQRNIPPSQLPSFPNFQVGYQGGFDLQIPQMDQNKDGGFGWQPKPPQGFYNECEPIDNSSQPWYQSPVYNNSNNNFNNNNNNYMGNNNNNNNNYMGNNNNNSYMGNNNNNYMGNNNNNNNNYMGNNKDGPSGWNDWSEPRFGNSETTDLQKLKPANLNCDNKPSNNTDNKPSSSRVKKPPAKRPIPFALNKKKSKPASESSEGQDVQSKDAESDPKKTPTQKKDPNSTDSDSTKKTEIKAPSETAEKKIPFPKKSSAPKVTEEPPRTQTKPSDTYVQELFDKLYQAEFKENVGASNFGGASSEKGNSVKATSTTEQILDKTFSVHDVSESDLRKLQDHIKAKIESKTSHAKNVPKQSSTNNEPKIKTTVSSLKQGLKTTILLPTPGKKTEENLPGIEDLTKLLNIVDKAINVKTEPLKLNSNEWETSYQSFLKSVQKKQLIPGQHHKWVRKKELPPEPPLPETVPPPTAEVSIDDVVNARLMKELLLEQEFSESTSVSEADSLYLPPTEERKKRKTNSSLTTRRQTKKKAAFDMTSCRRRRKRQKMQRKAAADFGASSLALTTNSSGLDDDVYNFWDPNFKGPEVETSLNDDLLSYNKEGPSNAAPTNESLSKGPTLKELGFNNWKDAMVSLKFQPVVALKNCVQEITSHLQQEGSSNMMEWVGSQKELRETLNLPPDHLPVALSSTNTSKSTNSSSSSTSSSKSSANTKVPATTASKSSAKTKVTKNIAMEYQSMNDTISINSIKASVRSEITKIKKTQKSVLSDADKKKVSKPKPTVAEIPRIKAKLPPEKSFTPSAKSDTPLQHSTNNPKEVKKPTPTSGLLSQNPQPKSTVSANKALPPKGIIKNSRPDSAVTKTSLVSPATFPPTDQSLKVDLLMESISAPPTSAPSEAEQKRLAEQKKVAEQKKQKISFQAYMEKKIKTKPAKSPPREKTNVFETFKDFLSPEPDNVKKTVSEKPITPPILIPPPTIAPVVENLKPSLVVPPVGSAFSNSVFGPRSPTPQVPVLRDPRIPSKLPLPFSKEPTLPKIISTIPKKPKEELKSCLNEKPIKLAPTMSHRKAPPPKTIPISMDEVQKCSEAPVDPRLSRKLPSNQPELPSVKEPLSKTPVLIEPLLPRDPRLLKVYGDFQAEGAASSKQGGKSPAQEGLPSIKLKPDPTEYVSDIIRKAKPPVKKDTWNLFTISTDDEVPIPTRKPFLTEEEASSRKKPGVLGESIPAYAQFSKDVSIETRISSDEGTRIAESQEAGVDRQSWGFYREMSLKMPSLENAASVSDKESKGSTHPQKSDDNTCSDMDIVAESPKGLYFSDSDEDLTKPLYIDEGASGATPRRDSFENYNFSLKNTGRDLKTGRMDSRSSFASSQVLKTLPHFSENMNTKTTHANNFGIYSSGTFTPEDMENKKMSPFNETVPPADPESNNATGSSLFCAYQMEGKSELKDMSHIWMKSLSTLSQAKAVSSLEISDEVLDVLRKVVKENIPAGQKHLPQVVPFPTPNSTACTNIPKKPDTLDKDYKLGVLDKDLFHSKDSQKEFVRPEHVSLQQPHTLTAGVNIDGKLETCQPGNSNPVKLEQSERNRLNEIYNPSDPVGDETTVKPPAGSMPDPQAFVPGQAIPVLSGKKQSSFHKGAKKSRSASPTTTAATPAPIQSPNYFPQSSGWMASQQPPFWLNQGLNQKFDGVWPNLPPFNPIVTGSIPWPPPLNIPPSHLTNLPFPLNYVPPDLPAYPPSQADSLKPPNLFDWFADKINPKAGTSNNDTNPTKANKSPRATSEINVSSSSASKPTSVSENDTPTQAQTSSSNSADLTPGTDTKTSRNNHGDIQIPKSEKFSELAPINSDSICGISKADPDKSKFSSYSPTSEIVSISASDPSMSPSALDSVESAGKEVPFKLKRTFSIDSSLSSESSRSSKNDSLNKKEAKPMKSESTNLTAATPPSSHDSEKSACPKAELTVNDPSIKPSTSNILDAKKQTPDLHDGDASISEKSTDLVKDRESNKDSKKSKSREERRREKKATSSSTSSKASHASSGSSKSVKEAKLAKANRDKLRKLTRQFLKNNGKSDLQNLLKSVKQIKRELASQPSHEKGGSSETSDRKSVHLPSRSKPASSEVRSSSSRAKKFSEKDEKWSEKFWKPIKSVEDDVLPSSSGDSTKKKTKSSSIGKHSTSKQNAKASATKTSEHADDISKDPEEIDTDKPADEAKNSDLELEEGELPDKESEDSGDEAMVDVHSKHKSSSRRKEESSRRKRRQPDRRHTSHEERFYKRRMRQTPTEEENPNDDNYPYDRLDAYPYDSPDRYVHDRTENYMHSRMDNVDRYLGSRVEYPHDGPDNCPPERSGFYPPNRMDRYNAGNPDDFDRGKRKRFRSKRGRPLRGKFAPFAHNNYPDQNFNDYSPEKERYPRDRKENYSYGEPDRCISKTFGVSTDPDDYVQDESDGLLCEKSSEYGSFKQGYSDNWPDRHRRRRRSSYSPGPDGDYSDGSFRGRGTPPRDERPLHSGRHSGDGLPKMSRSREIKEDGGGSVGIRKSVSSDNLTADYFSETDKEMEPTMTGDHSMQTVLMQNEDDEDEKNMRDTFDTIDSYLLTYVKEGSAEYKILKKSLGMPLETKFDDMSKTKRKKIRKKIQSQLQALKQAPSISTNEGIRSLESDSNYFQSSERSSFKGDNDLQKSSMFEGKPNYLEYLNNWLNQRPDEDQYVHSRLDIRYDSEDDGKSSCFGTDTVEDLSIADPEIRQAIKTVAWMEKSSGFGTPHQRIPLNLLLAEEKDNMFSFEGSFLILMRKIPRKAVERLATLREVLNTLTCELQEAQKENDIMKFQKLQATKNKLHDRRKYMLEKFTGWISPNRLQMIMEAKNIYQNCLEYLQRKPDPLPNIDREFVVKTIKAIQGHINLTKKFLDEQASSSNTTPSMSSSGFCPDMARPNPPPDAALSWYGPRNMDPPMPGFYNKQPWNNAPF